MKDWRDKAACKGLDSSIFTPERITKENVRQAKDICAACPVRKACLEAYMWLPDRVIAGGTTYRERQALKRQRWRESEAMT